METKSWTTRRSAPDSKVCDCASWVSLRSSTSPVSWRYLAQLRRSMNCLRGTLQSSQICPATSTLPLFEGEELKRFGIVCVFTGLITFIHLQGEHAHHSVSKSITSHPSDIVLVCPADPSWGSLSSRGSASCRVFRWSTSSLFCHEM